MAYSNIVLQPALHVWTCLNVYIVKYTVPWNKDLAINAPQVIPQISSLLYQGITLQVAADFQIWSKNLMYASSMC